MFKRAKSVLACVAAVAIIISGCAKSDNAANDSKESSSDNGKLKVYTSFYPMYDFTKKIGGDKIDLHNLVPAGTEPHDWEPSTKDLVNIQGADMLIYNGAGMEHWIDKVTESADNKKLVKVEASKGLELLKMNHNDEEEDDKKGEEHEHGNIDPHVWTSIKNARVEMKNIKDALVEKDAKNKDYYEANFKKYDKELADLDKQYEETLAKTPKKKIIVQHEAYGYLCKAYGLQQEGISGLSPEEEPDPAKMKEVIDYAKKNNVKVIFFEDLVSPKVAKTIAKEVGAKAEVLNPVEGLTEDQLKKGEDYISVMKDNLERLKDALQ